MAGIFNIFGGISEPDKGQVIKPLVRSKTSLGIGGNSAKAVGPSKPKGLSMRPNSDLNIPASIQLSGLKSDNSNNKHDFLKPKLTQLDNTGCPISPSKNLSVKKLNVQSNKAKSPSGKITPLENKMMNSRKLFNEAVFKKPCTPKKFIKRSMYPEPENLAPYYDFQLDFDIYTQTFDNEVNEFKKLRGKEEIKPYEDEGFESDPEELISVNIPTLSKSSDLFEDEWKPQWSPILPEISDNEDEF